jgi:predicted phage terminase large subunit-like protein
MTFQLQRPLPSVDERRVLDAITRQDFETFAKRAFRELHGGQSLTDNWHVRSICWHLEQIRIATINKLIIAMPPRSLKSFLASVAFPAFVHGHDPGRKIICASYAQALSTKHHNDYRTLLKSPFYREIFRGTRVSPEKDTEGETVLTAGGMRLATSVGGTLTGRGGDIVILDDPLKADDAMSETRRRAAIEWYSTTLVSRLNDKRTGAIIIISQRLHMDDLIGFVLSNSRAGWEVLELPAIAQRDYRVSIGDDLYRLYRKDDVLQPGREPLEVLEQLRTTMGSDAFSAQYLQEPVPPGGNMFKRDWVLRYDNVTASEPRDEIIQSWDTAQKDGPSNDWSVCTTFLKRGGLFFLLDCFRKRLDYPDLRASAISLASRHQPKMVIVEDTGVGTALIAELRRAGINVRPSRPEKGKETRAAVQTAVFEGGRVYLPKKAPWLDELEAELFAFPGSRHDDQVDSICQALAYERMRPITKTTYVRTC